MWAVVVRGTGEVAAEHVEDARIEAPTEADGLLDEVRINVAAGYMTLVVRFYIGHMRRIYQEAKLGQQAVEPTEEASNDE